MGSGWGWLRRIVRRGHMGLRGVTVAEVAVGALCFLMRRAHKLCGILNVVRFF